MARRTTLRDGALETLGASFELREKDLGADARLSAKGMTFITESWEVVDLGHLCVMQMRAFFGLMRMETVVVAPSHVDAPLFNLDWVKAFGTETQIAELYDTQLAPWPAARQDVFEAIDAAYADLPDAPAGDPRWYDDILYPCSFHKRGKGLSDLMSGAAQNYLQAYAQELIDSPTCDVAQKSSRTRDFAERLFKEGGPAVDQVTKLFGKQTAKRLILQHMYGVQSLP